MKCKICGCTDKDCSQCIAIQGHPCYWAQPDLCSRCENELIENSGIIKALKASNEGRHKIINILISDLIEKDNKINRLKRIAYPRIPAHWHL